MRKIIEPPALPKADVVEVATAASASSAIPSPPLAKSFDLVDLKQYFHIVVKRIWLVALCFVISLSVTVVNLVKQVPVFRSTSTILLSRGLNLPAPLRERDLENVLGDAVDTQLRILQSGMMIGRARERIARSPQEISEKLSRVQVYAVGKGGVLAVAVDALDAQFAADFANAMVDAFIDYKSEERMETSQATVISLTQQANRLREELRKAEERVLTFKRENSVVAIAERGNVAAGMLATLSGRSASYRAERMILQAQQPLLSQASDEVVLQTLAAPMNLSIAMMGGGRRARH